MIIMLTGALIIGLTLGLLGSGGSAITVPVLVYLVGHGTKQSIAESMAIVGLISVAAAIPYAFSKQIDWRSVLYFGIPGMLGTLAGAWLGGLATAALQLIVFGGVLIAAAYVMFRNPQPDENEDEERPEERERSPIWKIAIEGAVVGIVTGFVGVGGGFLIVPALVVFGKLPMRLAIGTSLVIIAAKAAVGFAKYQQYLLAHDLSVDVRTILTFVLIGAVGSLIGKLVNARLNQGILKKVFAVFLIVLGGFVIVNEAAKLVFPTVGESAAVMKENDPLRRSNSEPEADDPLSAAKWHARYETGKTGWDRGRANPALLDWLESGELQPCRVFVPGCGRGHEVVELAQRGFEVTALDFADKPLQELQRKLNEANLTAEVIQENILHFTPRRPFDAVYEQTSLCAIDPKHWEAYEDRIANCLVAEGRLFALFMQTSRPGGPPFACEPDAMRRLFHDSRWRWPQEQLTPVKHPAGMTELAVVLQRRSSSTPNAERQTS